AWPLLLFQLVLFLFLLQTGEATRDWIPVAPGWMLAFRLGVLALVLVLVALLPPGVPSRHYLNPSNFGIAARCCCSLGLASQRRISLRRTWVPSATGRFRWSSFAPAVSSTPGTPDAFPWRWPGWVHSLSRRSSAV